MTSPETDTRTLMSIDDETVVLAPDQDVGAIEQRLQDAVDHPQFVHVRLTDGTDLSFLMSIARRVSIATGARQPKAPPVLSLVDDDTIGVLGF